MSLFARAGVDYIQWKAVSRTLLYEDFRLPGSQPMTYSLRRAGAFVAMAAIYGMFGVAAAILVALNQDVLLTGTLTLTYVAFLVATSILTHHSGTLVSTTDYAILGPRPVSSRTFLAIRLTNILFHMMVVTTLMAYPAIAAFTFAHGVSLLRGAAATLAIYGCATATTVTLVAVYGAVLHTIGAERVQRVLGYSQIAIGVVAYGGFFIIADSSIRSVVVSATLPRSFWLTLLPPAWYASYLEIATGVGDASTWLRAALSVAAIGGLLIALGGRLGMEYAERLSTLAITKPPTRLRLAATPLPRFSAHELRVVALLISAHFRRDLRVRMSILAVVPLMLLYAYLGFRGEAAAVEFIVLMFPAVIMQGLSVSESHRAAWMYLAAPAVLPRMVMSFKNAVAVLVIAPFVIVLAALYTWQSAHIGHAVVHATMLGLIGHLALQGFVIVAPRLPFSQPISKATGTAATFGAMLVAITGGSVLIWALREWVYGSWLRVGLVGGGLLMATWIFDRVIRLRAASADFVVNS